MINRIATFTGKKIAQNIKPNKNHNCSNILDRFTDIEIEQILIYKITNNLKYCAWVFLISLITYMLWKFGTDIRYTTFTFFVIISLLRNMFGGYHHHSEMVCLVISTIIPILAGYLAIKLDYNIYFIVSVYVFSYLTAFFKKTVDNPNKRFEEGNKRLTIDRKNLLFKLGIILLISTTIVHIFVYFTGYREISNSMTLAVFISFVNLHLKNS